MDRPSNRFDRIDKIEAMPIGREGTPVSEAGACSPVAVQPSALSVSAPYGKLTPREWQVMHALSQGWSNKRIASELFVTQDTVKFHLKSSFRKIGVRSRTEALHVAYRLGLVQFR